MPGLLSAVVHPKDHAKAKPAASKSQSTSTSTSPSDKPISSRARESFRSISLKAVPPGSRHRTGGHGHTHGNASKGNLNTGENNGHGYQPTRAEQKALRKEQKEKDIQAGVLVLKGDDEALREKGSKPIVMMERAVEARFGVLEHSGRVLQLDRPRDLLSSITEEKLGQTILCRARIHQIRPMSAKLAFLIFRDGITTIQGVVRAGAGAEPAGSNGNGNANANANGNGGSAEMAEPSVSNTTTALSSRGGPPETLVGAHDSSAGVESGASSSSRANANGATPVVNGIEVNESGNGHSTPSSNENGTGTGTGKGNGNGNGTGTGNGHVAGAPHREDFAPGGAEVKSTAQAQQRHDESTPSNNNNPYTTTSGDTTKDKQVRGSISSLPSSSHEFANMTSSTLSSGVTEEMVRWAEKLPLETLVLVEGVVRRPEDDSDGRVKEVKSVSGGANEDVGRLEIEVRRLLVVSQVTNRKPFAVSQAAGDEGGSEANGGNGNGHSARVGFHSLLAHPALSLRTPTSHAIFKLVAACSRAARSFLDERDFTEIHSSKFQQGATESGASVFVVDYFRKQVTLAQSPQLAKEMCIGADFGRVYEIGPVFRAEHSNTHRHLCEFTGLDVEMTIDQDYHEAMYLIDDLLKHIFRTVQERSRAEIEAVKTQFPHDDLVFPDETVVLTFKEGIRMLRESGYRDDSEPENVKVEDLPEMDDLSTKAEVRLGQLVKEKYNTDYYILDKFRASARPFYTMPDPDDPTYSNSFDIFVRGEEILSGGQRLHHGPTLEAALEKAGIPQDSMREYLEAFQFGMPPHAGGGIGLERLVMLFFKLGNIRNATLLPRDPRSFLGNPTFDGKRGTGAGRAVKLPVPDGVANWDEPNVASEDPMYKPDDHPKLEDLIAKYGDSTNTAWTDPGYEIWRHAGTGFAVGFVKSKGHAVTWGAPLCPTDKLSEVLKAYLKWCHDDVHLGPIWANADEKTEEILVAEHNWRALAVTSEQRLDPSTVLEQGADSKHVEKKVRQAEAAGVSVKMVEGEITQEIRDEIDEGMRRWLEGREGEQIHTTSLRPWADVEHRTYFVARDKEQKACGLLVLEQLAPEHGYQIKWSLMFPGAPNGTSEKLITTAMRTLAEAGGTTATFGAGAKDTLDVVNGIGATRSKILSRAYRGISKTFGLTRKSHFRQQFGAQEDPLYVCYPPHGLGLRGISAIMDSVR